MKNIKEKQFLVNMAKALGQTPDPALVKEIEEYNQLMESVRSPGEGITDFFNQLAQLKDEVESIKTTVEVKQHYFAEPQEKDYPKPPTLDELMLTIKDEAVVEKEELPLEAEPEQTNPLVDAVSNYITRETRFEDKSFQQPDAPLIKTLNDIKKKIKFLEDWVSKISLNGPGSGEVKLLRLDDVDTRNLGDNKAIFYNAANAKLEFRTVSGGAGSAVDSVNGQSGNVSLTTTDIPEGTNEYFSNAKVIAALTAGTNITIEGNGRISSTATGGESSNLLSVTSAIVPDQDSIRNLGSIDKRWGTLYLANNTIDLGGALISSDGTGTIIISSTGAVLPINSKIAVGAEEKPIALLGATGAVTNLVPFYTKELGLNTIAANFTFGADVDSYVFTNFTLSNGSVLTQASNNIQFYF